MSIIDHTNDPATESAGERQIHPAWCNPDRCSEDRMGGYLRDVTHWTADQRFTFAQADAGATLVLARSDNHDGRLVDGQGVSAPYISLDGEGDTTIDELEAFGRWILTRAAEFRQAIATEFQETTLEQLRAYYEEPSVTVLDEDLDLKVESEGDTVGLSADTVGPEWLFSPDEARALAAALLSHAARVDVAGAAIDRALEVDAR